MRQIKTKPSIQANKNAPSQPIWIGLGVAILIGIAFFGTSSLLWYTQLSQRNQPVESAVPVSSTETNTVSFPIGVNPELHTITENPRLEQYIDTYLAVETTAGSRHLSRAKRFLTQLALSPLVQQLASPGVRTLVIYSGERREEVAYNFASILRWDDIERLQFLELVAGSTPTMDEGVFYPGKYVVERNATPKMVAEKVVTEFSTNISARYTKAVSDVVPLRDALTIASLLEREAFDFTDMRIISGIIWNRLFIDMPLQLDASLQYVKGSAPDMPWWPRVQPADKFLESPYNTYENAGLPPGPIANPSVEAIVAALNPKQTDCLYYFHDSDGAFYCNQSYEGHVADLTRIYGQGR